MRCVASKKSPNRVDLTMGEALKKMQTTTVKEERRREMTKGRREGEEKGGEGSDRRSSSRPWRPKRGAGGKRRRWGAKERANALSLEDVEEQQVLVYIWIVPSC